MFSARRNSIIVVAVFASILSLTSFLTLDRAAMSSDDLIERAHLFSPTPYGARTPGYGSLQLIGDLNGDGYDDLVTGNSVYSIDFDRQGMIYVYFGGGTQDYIPDWSIKGTMANQNLGTYGNGVIADFNNDGIDDLIYGQTFYSSGDDSGRLWVFFGDENNGGDITIEDADVKKSGTVDSMYRLGRSLSTGDFNGDGVADLVASQVAVTYSDNETYIYYGNEDFDLEFPDVVITPYAGQYYPAGATLTGDFNDDGYADLVLIDLVYNAASSKKAYLYWGGSPFNTTHDVTFSYEDPANAQSHYWASYQTSQDLVGDLNNDGRADICLTAYANNTAFTQGGAVYCWYGPENSSDWEGDIVSSSADKKLYGQREYDAFGRFLYLYDVTNDGYKDLLVGAYETNNSVGKRHGRIYVYKNTEDGLETDYWLMHGYDTYDKTLGNSIVAVDWDNDGWASLIPNEGSNPREPALWFYDLAHGESDFEVTPLDPTNNTTPTLVGTVTNGTETVSYEKVATIFGLGSGSEWDTVHAGYNPSIIKDGDTYKMWYSSQASKWAIGYATSTDGINWTKNEGSDCSGLTGDGCVFTTGVSNS